MDTMRRVEAAPRCSASISENNSHVGSVSNNYRLLLHSARPSPESIVRGYHVFKISQVVVLPSV